MVTNNNKKKHTYKLLNKLHGQDITLKVVISMSLGDAIDFLNVESLNEAFNNIRPF